MISFEDFKKLDLRIAEIIDVSEHPDADKLYVLKIRLDDETKQIVAGIRSSYDAGSLKGKKIAVVNNLEPVMIRGEESNGMLLAASNEGGPVILVPERDVPSGAQITMTGRSIRWSRRWRSRRSAWRFLASWPTTITSGSTRGMYLAPLTRLSVATNSWLPSSRSANWRRIVSS